MAYNNHGAPQGPPYNVHDDDDYEDHSAEHQPLTAQGPSPFDHPYDGSHDNLGQQEHATFGNLQESYVDGARPTSSAYSSGGDTIIPQRVPSPYSRSETSSTEAWRQRQAPPQTGGAGGLKRYQTRKVKLVQGSVFVADYPVPSAIQNSIQAKYKTKDEEEGGNEEFSTLRCK